MMCVFTAVHVPEETLRVAVAGTAPLGGCECAPCVCELARPQLLPVLLSLRGHLARRASVFQGPGLSHEALLGSQVTGSSFPCRAGPTGLSPPRGVLSEQLPRTRGTPGPPALPGHVSEALGGCWRHSLRPRR